MLTYRPYLVFWWEDLVIMVNYFKPVENLKFDEAPLQCVCVWCMPTKDDTTFYQLDTFAFALCQVDSAKHTAAFRVWKA